MKVLFAASECAPMVKVGGLGDVIGSLPKALGKIGVNPAVIIPCYEIVSTKRLKRIVSNFKILFSGKREIISVYQGLLPKSKIPIFYIENRKYLSIGGPVYFSRTAVAGGVTEFDRFQFFSRAVHELLASGLFPFKPDIIHANDWHTGFLTELLGASPFKLPTVFTIHNLGNQGVYGENNPMKMGIENASAVTTVSRTYAKEIQTKEYGCGLEKSLRKVSPIGILNGIDYEILASRYSKNSAKKKLQKMSGLKSGLSYPVFGLVSRLVWQKGIQLIVPLVDKFVKKYDAQFVFLGVGEDRFEKDLKFLADKYPKNISTIILFSEKLAREIYIGSDFFLIPSIFEPSGLGQMIAMHYRTIPIARKTGGLKDTVREGRTGFVFSSEDIADFKKAMERALKTFYNKKKLFHMRTLCKKQDFSWKRSAQKYKKLYEKIL